MSDALALNIMYGLIVLYCLLIPTHRYGKDVEAANTFLTSQYKKIRIINKTSKANSQETISIVFPEIIRWNAFQDLMETKSLELAYVKFGRKGADFSIGHFQMKPSFVEQLENYVEKHQDLKYLNYVVITEQKIIKARRIRLYRLKSFLWQLRYAHVFWLVANHRFRYMKFHSAEDRIHFYATAYNYGFRKDDKKIKAWQNQAFFPFGGRYKGVQVKYADLSIEFYQKYSHKYK